jgi:hypothetical protein
MLHSPLFTPGPADNSSRHVHPRVISHRNRVMHSPHRPLPHRSRRMTRPPSSRRWCVVVCQRGTRCGGTRTRRRRRACWASSSTPAPSTPSWRAWTSAASGAWCVTRLSRHSRDAPYQGERACEDSRHHRTKDTSPHARVGPVIGSSRQLPAGWGCEPDAICRRCRTGGGGAPPRSPWDAGRR